ncbi:hypothetical protein HDU97_007188 [Phlyctochytrium planicorne]|nr:hypothetical protein HDU97_007188 [Phlyctochytrium planicorne]
MSPSSDHHHASYKPLDEESSANRYQQIQTGRRIIFIGALIIFGISTAVFYAVSSRPKAQVNPIPHFYEHKKGVDVQDLVRLLCAPVSPRPPKIAVCMAGNAKTLKYPIVYQTFQTNVVEALGADVKVFAYLKMQESSGDKEKKTFWSKAANTREDDLKHALSILRPETVKFSYESPPIAENSRCPFGHGTWFSNNTERIQKTLDDFNTLNECYKLIEDYEQSKGIKFEMIVRARPDTAWLYPIPPWCGYSPSKVYAPATYTDHFNVMSRNQAPAVFGSLKYYREECTKEITTYNPELFLAERILTVTTSKPTFFPFGVNVIREVGEDNTQSMCYQLGGYIGDVGRCKLLLETQQNRV